MPARKKADVDVDALLKEAAFKEPEPVDIRWRGKVWKMKRLSAVDPRLIGSIDTVSGVLAALDDALLSDADRDTFPMPRAVALDDGRTELSVFLTAWAEASGEVVQYWRTLSL